MMFKERNRKALRRGGNARPRARGFTLVELLLVLIILALIGGLVLPNIIGRAEGFASKNPVGVSALDGFMMGLGFLIVLTLLGMLREAIGLGTLFAQAELMFGRIGESLTLTLIPDHPGFLLAILPPGAFIGLGLLIAARNGLSGWLAGRDEGRRAPGAQQAGESAA